MKGEPNNSSEADEDSDVTRVKKAISTSATMAASWALVHQGKGLHELALDPFTCSEILRLHILSSGANLGKVMFIDCYNRYLVVDLTICSRELRSTLRKINKVFSSVAMLEENRIQ